MTLWILLPAYNEESNITRLMSAYVTVHQFMPMIPMHLVIVNDGSSDETRDVVMRWIQDREGFSQRMSFTLLNHEVNKGLAEALKTGFSYVCERAGHNDVVVTMDADFSHRPGAIPAMVAKILEGYDVVIASRYRPGAAIEGLASYRKMMSSCARVLFRLIFPIPGLRDYTCGYRAYRADVLQRAFRDDARFISESGFSCMVDILLKLHVRYPELCYSEVPLHLRYDTKEGVSKMRVGRTVADTLRLMVCRRMGIKR